LLLGFGRRFKPTFEIVVENVELMKARDVKKGDER
jgi:hypothetical protein